MKSIEGDVDPARKYVVPATGACRLKCLGLFLVAMIVGRGQARAILGLASLPPSLVFGFVGAH